MLSQVTQEGVGEYVGDGEMLGGAVGAILADGGALAARSAASGAVAMPGSESFFEK